MPLAPLHALPVNFHSPVADPAVQEAFVCRQGIRYASAAAANVQDLNAGLEDTQLDQLVAKP